ncbi:hypothetical protein M8818_004535 [Zalaria obscura]|uniref:Uncharacterized protein n=1 Tax=Zalaria obscura TaxID=2024903 RepID=A0ACC3SC79_9PEZI
MSVSDQTTAFFEQRPSSHPATLPTKRDTETSPKVKSGDGQTNAYLRPAVKRKYSGVEVEELSEDDIGYASDIEVIYPDELEEVEGDTESGDDWPSENNLGDPESLMFSGQSSESGSPGGDALEARSCTQSPAREDGGRKTTAPVAFWVLEDPMDIDSADG